MGDRRCREYGTPLKPSRENSTTMELEGFGVPLLGRAVWVFQNGSAAVPWEFIRANNYSMRVLIRGGSSNGPSALEVEEDWTCVWTPTTSRDWSCIATCLKSVSGGAAGAGSVLVVLDSLQSAPPSTFWQFMDSLAREGRVAITRIWINAEGPPFVPDAIFFPPMSGSLESAAMYRVFSALPARAGHGGWSYQGPWDPVVAATHEQGMGLVVSDIEEPAWTLMWHRPEDSRQSIEKRAPRAAAIIRAGLALLN